MILLSKHWKQSLYSNSLHYVSVKQRILNKSNEIQTEELLLPKPYLRKVNLMVFSQKSNLS